MFTQLFGGYLLNQGIISPRDLMGAMQEEAKTRKKLGALAVHFGYLTPEQVEEIRVMQTHEDLPFGELAIKKGYLTRKDLDELLTCQPPQYMLLGQILTEKNLISDELFCTMLANYQRQYDQEHSDDDFASANEITQSICKYLDLPDEDNMNDYLKLLFRNLVRFIGTDFTVGEVVTGGMITLARSSSQTVINERPITLTIEMNEPTAIAFANRYVAEEFNVFDEFVAASLEDFINLHNGLFIVNMSKNYDIEMQLTAPKSLYSGAVNITGDSFLLTITYPFGDIRFLVSTNLPDKKKKKTAGEHKVKASPLVMDD